MADVYWIPWYIRFHGVGRGNLRAAQMALFRRAPRRALQRITTYFYSWI
jgi:hypothetical protein